MLTKVHIVNGFSSSHVQMLELDHKEGWGPKNWCFQIVGKEDSWESLRQHGDKISQSWRKSTLNIHWKDWCWSSNALSTWCEQPTHWKRPWCWGRLRAGGKGGNRGWDGWMASLTQGAWVWANSGREGRTGKPGMLQSTRSQRVRHSNWTTT